MESPPGTGGGAQGDGMKHKEQLWGPFLLSHTCNKSCGLQSGPASTPNAPRALGTPPRLLVPPCGQATRPQSRCPHSLPRAALLRRPLAAPRGSFLCPPRCPQNPARPLRSPLLLLGQGGGQAGAPRRFHQREPKCHQIRPATCAHHRGVGAQGHGWPHGDWHPAVTPSWGFATRKKSPASCPKPCPAPWPGRKPMCFPHFVPGASPNFLTVFLGVLPTQTISEEGAAPL